MKKISFNIENSPLSEFDAENLTIKFKNGRTYALTNRSYISGVSIGIGRFDLLNQSSIEEQLLEKRNSQIVQEAKWRGEEPRTVKHIKLEQFENGLELNDITGYMVQPERDVISNLKFTADSVKKFEGEPDEAFPQRIYDSLNTAFTQFGKYMGSNVKSCQYADVKDKVFPKMYFYTYGATDGRAEIWYKAIDPIIWFGTLIGKAGK